MRILMIATGSRGDVEPYIALGVGLRAAGYEVRVLTHEALAPLASARPLGLVLLVEIALVWITLLVYQIPCFLGVPNCDWGSMLRIGHVRATTRGSRIRGAQGPPLRSYPVLSCPSM